MKFLAIIFLFATSILGAQTHRYIYELKLKMDSTETDYQKSYMVLDIGQFDTKFYGRDLLVTDSLNNKFGNLDNRYVDMTGQIVKRKNGTSKNENFINIKFEYYSFFTSDPITWNILRETKSENEYTLQKATGNFGGRKWIAWFNKDIPFNEGPYKFSGLPGLIFEIMDDKQNFIYKLVKNQNLKEAITINEQQKRKLLLNFYNDPFAFERESFKNNTDLKINIGDKEAHNIEELNTLVKSMQSIIRKYNNPLEIEKVIHYK
jgi:GLPGLI family protein